MISAGVRPALIKRLLAAKVEPQMQAVMSANKCQNKVGVKS